MTLSVAHLAEDKEFPYAKLLVPKPSGGWTWSFSQLHMFYTTRGYFVYRESVDKWYIIRIIDNIVKKVGKKDLKDEILNFIVNEDKADEWVYNIALKDIARATSDEFLETLPAKEVKFKRDLPGAIQIYYQNCIAKITKDKVTTFPYTSLNGYIWESQILPRNYTDAEVLPTSDFARFINNLGNGDQARIDSLCTGFGFYIHNYKSAAYCPALILNDEVISDNPEGGTGKGLYFKAVSQFVKMLTIDGKTFNFDKSFVYQRVTADTKLIFFDDVKANFDFERLFSVITEGISTEKKGKDEVYTSFDDSPKVGLSTNYAIRGAGNSHDRRKMELEISQYYNKERNPESEFGRMMFSGWDDAEWTQFDNYMVFCCRVYLTRGLVKQELINLPAKRILAETSHEFTEFMEEIEFKPGWEITKRSFYDSFIKYNPKSKLQNKSFYKYVQLYSDYHKLNIIELKTNGVWTYRVRELPDVF